MPGGEVWGAPYDVLGLEGMGKCTLSAVNDKA